MRGPAMISCSGNCLSSYSHCGYEDSKQRDIEKREHKSSESSNKAYWKRLEE